MSITNDKKYLRYNIVLSVYVLFEELLDVFLHKKLFSLLLGLNLVSRFLSRPLTIDDSL